MTPRIFLAHWGAANRAIGDGGSQNASTRSHLKGPQMTAPINCRQTPPVPLSDGDAMQCAEQCHPWFGVKFSDLDCPHWLPYLDPEVLGQDPARKLTLDFKTGELIEPIIRTNVNQGKAA